jgi:hypothetical protein
VQFCVAQHKKAGAPYPRTLARTTSENSILLGNSVNKGERQAGDPPFRIPGTYIAWKVTLCVSLPLCCDEPRDDTDNHAKHRALGH